MNRRDLERRLESVADFPDPDAAREQYLTPPDLASHLLHVAAMRGDLDGTVLDLGCGTGMLALGAALLAPERVVGVDVDAGALAVARENAARLSPPVVPEWVRGDVASLPLRVDGATVLANPPFGAQRGRAGADRAFLRAAAETGRVSYTVHNAGSRDFVESFVADLGGEVTDAFAAELTVPRRFDFHDDAERTLAVEVFRVRYS